MCREDSSTPMLVDPSQETPHVHGEDRTNARAGTARRGFQKHPHVRGEDCRISSPRLNGGETPPRAWGKTSAEGEYASALRKHPHVRGEDLNGFQCVNGAKETPPRAWGRPSTKKWPDIKAGNTPTCVGKTCMLRLLTAAFRKHPHVRGEDR